MRQFCVIEMTKWEIRPEADKSRRGFPAGFVNFPDSMLLFSPQSLIMILYEPLQTNLRFLTFLQEKKSP